MAVLHQPVDARVAICAAQCDERLAHERVDRRMLRGGAAGAAFQPDFPARSGRRARGISSSVCAVTVASKPLVGEAAALRRSSLSFFPLSA